MANIERHPKETTGANRAGWSQRRRRATHAHAGARQNSAGRHLPAVEDGGASFILRFEDLPANPDNVERMRDRVRQLNRRLAESGAPFRFRLV